jgi:hypothetical protein
MMHRKSKIFTVDDGVLEAEMNELVRRLDPTLFSKGFRRFSNRDLRGVGEPQSFVRFEGFLHRLFDVVERNRLVFPLTMLKDSTGSFLF